MECCRWAILVFLSCCSRFAISRNWHIFHGQNRKEVERLGDFDIVITTFHTISAIWRRENEKIDTAKSIFTYIWYRVILDEGHIIQNVKSQLAEACNEIKSPRRWAITGTPIQNKLTDFASIVRFLKVFPYSYQAIFEEDISRPWHRGDKEGFLRLNILVRAITISRTKAVVDQIHHLDFDPVEREIYDTATSQTKVLMEKAISTKAEGANYNTLQRLNILRLICCHGRLARSQEKRITSNPQSPGWSAIPHQDSLFQSVVGCSATCCHCGIYPLQSLLEASPSAELQARGTLANYGGAICDDCNSQLGWTRPPPFPHFCPQLDIPEISNCPSPASTVEVNDVLTLTGAMSTKIKALVSDLLRHSESEKSVVFSFWTYTLDLIQMMLDEYGIRYTRIDGKTSLPKRTAALKAFQKDKSLRVILVSITCGGAGLDLTAASRAYLLEPHWNPMIEEQALCRVHRVGQTRNVTTVRYIMRDSFEEQIVLLQKRKKMLAQMTFGQAPLQEKGIGLGELEYLRSVLG